MFFFILSFLAPTGALEVQIWDLCLCVHFIDSSLLKGALTRSCQWLINRPPLFQLSETHKNMKKQLLGFSFLPYLSSAEKVNPQRCLIYFYETSEFEKEVVDILTSRHERVKVYLV